MSDLRLAARLVRRNPGSTLAIAGLLALGIGATTVIFSVFDAVMLRPLPVRHPETLVRMVQRLRRTGTISEWPFDYYQALRDHSTTLTAFAETPADFDFAMTDPKPTEQVSVRAVTPEYFSTLGVNALYGRVLTASDEKEKSGTPPAVLSYGFWQRRFNGNVSAIGRTITLHGVTFVVVGVMPRKFNGLSADTAPDVRIPNAAYPLLTGYPGVHRSIELYGRLKPGVTPAQAQAECQSFFQSVVVPYYRGILKESPQNGAAELIKAGMSLDSLERGTSILRDRFTTTLDLLMGSVCVLLLIICSNVTGLLLARSVARHQEIAVRLAMGATRFRLIRQMLAENALLAIAGAAGGLWMAFLGAPLALRALPPIRDLSTKLFPVALNVQPNGRVFLFTLALFLLILLLFGVAPAIAASRYSLDSALRSVRASASDRGRSMLITVQIALCTFLLAVAGLFVHTFHNLRDIQPGFDEDRVATFTGDLALTNKDPSLLQRLTERVEQIPGVASAAISSVGVMRGHGVGNTVAPTGHRTTPADFLDTNYNDVSPGYFSTMGMHILAGRALRAEDAPGVNGPAGPVKVVVNRAFARRFFPNIDPIGQRFGAGRDKVVGADYEIVGVVSNARYRSLREPIAPAYFDVETKFDRFVLNVRTGVRPDSIFEPVRKALASIDPSMAFLEVHTLAEEVEASAAGEHTTAVLGSILGVLAALVAGVGLYAVLAFAVAQRRREIGIRMALGAESIDIAALTARQTLVMAAVGISAGLGGAVAVAPLIRSLLYGVSPQDPASLAGAAAFVLMVAAIATAIPAARAARVQPAAALRQEN